MPRPLVVLLLLCACGPAMPYDEPVDWRFADGRACAEAGVARVVLQVPGRTATSAPCTAGQGDQRVTLPALVPGTPISATALSPANDPLYRGAATLPDPPDEYLDLTLYYTGGTLIAGARAPACPRAGGAAGAGGAPWTRSGPRPAGTDAELVADPLRHGELALGGEPG